MSENHSSDTRSSLNFKFRFMDFVLLKTPNLAIFVSHIYSVATYHSNGLILALRTAWSCPDAEIGNPGNLSWQKRQDWKGDWWKSMHKHKRSVRLPLKTIYGVVRLLLSIYFAKTKHNHVQLWSHCFKEGTKSTEMIKTHTTELEQFFYDTK